MNGTKYEASPATLLAVVDALGALTFALSRQLNSEQQDGLASDLSRMAKDAQLDGDLLLETLLLDMHQKARTGAGAVRPLSTDGGVAV